MIFLLISKRKRLFKIGAIIKKILKFIFISPFEFVIIKLGEKMNKEYMSLANRQAHKHNFKEGGPFGAIIVKNGKIVAQAHNQVLKKKDPTAHAEILAIRKACKKLHTYDLTGCVLYTSCEPCPMCLSATIWANIKEVYYGNTRKDAAEIGFRDDFIYDLFESGKSDLKIQNINRDITIQTFQEFEKNKNKKIY